MGLNDNSSPERLLGLIMREVLQNGWDDIVGPHGEATSSAVQNSIGLLPVAVKAVLSATKSERLKTSPWTKGRCQKLFSDLEQERTANGDTQTSTSQDEDTSVAATLLHSRPERRAEVAALPSGSGLDTHSNFRVVRSGNPKELERKRKRHAAEISLIHERHAHNIYSGLEGNSKATPTSDCGISLFVWQLGIETSGPDLGDILKELDRKGCLGDVRVLLLQEISSFEESGGAIVWKTYPTLSEELEAEIKQVRAVLEVRSAPNCFSVFTG